MHWLATASDKVYQLLAHGRWFSPGIPASFTAKIGRHDIAEILLKVALNTIHKYINQSFIIFYIWFVCFNFIQIIIISYFSSDFKVFLPANYYYKLLLIHVVHKYRRCKNQSNGIDNKTIISKAIDDLDWTSLCIHKDRHPDRQTMLIPILTSYSFVAGMRYNFTGYTTLFI